MFWKTTKIHPFDLWSQATAGLTDSWIERQTDRQIDKQIDRQICTCFYLVCFGSVWFYWSFWEGSVRAHDVDRESGKNKKRIKKKKGKKESIRKTILTSRSLTLSLSCDEISSGRMGVGANASLCHLTHSLSFTTFYVICRLLWVFTTLIIIYRSMSFTTLFGI